MRIKSSKSGIYRKRSDMLEKIMIQTCAPTLAGIKTANMFTVPYKDREHVLAEIRRLNKILVPKGLSMIPMRFSKKRALIYLFRPEMLKTDLNDHKACLMLAEKGYCCSSTGCSVAKLMNKLRNEDEFPHEIGLFLGYPPEDVEGFIENRAENFKCSGCWKVYGDQAKAEETFRRYKKCSELYYRNWKCGMPVEKLAVSA